VALVTPRLLIWLAFALPCAAFAQGHPLFQSDETLTLLLELPLDTLIDDARDKPEVEGTLSFRDQDGKDVRIEMTMTTRGRSRLEYCQFPPLKIDLKKDQAAGTVFEGQNKLKVVTHCRDGSVHERYLRQEFGMYKAYRELSDASFSTRWLSITYKDTDGKRNTSTHPAFFIESVDELADRLGREIVEQNKIRSEALDPAESSKYALFQYLIGNTDWSMIKGPGDEGCCHNGKVLAVPGTDSGWIVVPYDFDQSGLMNTRYARPAPALKIRSVRQRLYRGRCRHNDQIPATVQLFNQKRGDIEEDLTPDGVDAGTNEKSLNYVNAFYEIINDSDKRQKYLVGACIGS